MSTQPTGDEPRFLHLDSLGEAWLSVARLILSDGASSRYDGRPIREIALVTLVVDQPDPADPTIGQLGDQERLAWMHSNFTSHDKVTELGGSDSYATRLFDYEHSGLDQIAWAVDRLRGDPASRSATITTFQPLSDTAYVPCVSLLDFWLRGDAVELIAYAHSIDFGTKGYANLAELAALLQHVAARLERPAGRLILTVKSAHVYEEDLAYVQSVTNS